MELIEDQLWCRRATATSPNATQTHVISAFGGRDLSGKIEDVWKGDRYLREWNNGATGRLEREVEDRSERPR